MIIYLLKSGILLFIFYAVYILWLENEKMLHFNRIYLLGSLVFSFVIPMQIISFGSAVSNKIGLIQLDELVIQRSIEKIEVISTNDFIIGLIGFVYVFVLLFLIIRFVLNLHSFYKKSKSNETRFINGEKILLIEETVLPHSFWKTIYINKHEFENGKIPSELIAHEKAHLEQRHTLDILFIEVLQIVFWFNPLFMFYKKAIKLNHEFLADEFVNKQFGAVKSYQNLLLDFASDKNTISLASNINYLITKKRLLMMTKKENPVKIVFKVFTVGIVYALLLLVFSAKSIAQSNINALNKNDLKISYDTTSIKEPQFPQGIEEFYKFVGSNFKMPSVASKSKVSGKILMEFIVEKDGSLSEIKVLKDLGYGLGEEAIRVLKLSPKWNPASKNGLPVRVQYSLPITIQTDK
ncbi:M56 family metallopeptidase [Flavobacterium piscis]|uniref:Beta-lactamase regulating signal transducer with metallopeptidase domain n=1 Tax=Flavobacterium piscis TaxID=1114874 RepID=A0ABU1Y2B0_9FLAO|nr:M56 family metallopeptidase [Flavobacterium piscis]MDR7208352.1 beta-lactamase regulating signal transducer with metallopeptidase domain [Flavobacterium piscis]